MNIKELSFKLLNKNARLPKYSHYSDSGMDVYAAENITIPPLQPKTISLGIACNIPVGYELQVRPRSGLSKNGIVGMWGTCDQGYRGEIAVTLYNFSKDEFDIVVGDRIAQLVLSPVSHAESIIETDTLDTTDRGVNGFGSTGR